ncbi:hypothetical protein EVJ21_06560 [Exiguobacterium sp. SH0S2]|nr:hypothetical protein EVJ21_06560 [Exiguobacterium sp. SH0S2]
MEIRQHRAEDSVKTYRNTLRRFEKLMDESNVLLLKDVDETAHAFMYRDELVEHELALNTIKKYVSVLKTFMSYSVAKG